VRPLDEKRIAILRAIQERDYWLSQQWDVLVGLRAERDRLERLNAPREYAEQPVRQSVMGM